jgi:hypothetical protein
MSTELNDYRGSLRADMKFEEFSKEFLLKLMRIWQDMWTGLNYAYIGLIAARLGEDEAVEIATQAAETMAPAIMPRLAELAGIQPKTLVDYWKATQLTIDNITDKFPAQLEIKSPNHVIQILKECETMEIMKDNPELLHKICTKLEARWQEAYSTILR